MKALFPVEPFFQGAPCNINQPGGSDITSYGGEEPGYAIGAGVGAGISGVGLIVFSDSSLVGNGGFIDFEDSSFDDYDVFPPDSFPPPQERGPRNKVLQKFLRLFQNPDCIRFLQGVIQQATLLAAGQANFAGLDSGGQQLYNTNPYGIITQVMNAQLINQGSQNPQQGLYTTRAKAEFFDYPKTITLYAGYFGTSTGDRLRS